MVDMYFVLRDMRFKIVSGPVMDTTHRTNHKVSVMVRKINGDHLKMMPVSDIGQVYSSIESMPAPRSMEEIAEDNKLRAKEELEREEHRAKSAKRNQELIDRAMEDSGRANNMHKRLRERKEKALAAKELKEAKEASKKKWWQK